MIILMNSNIVYWNKRIYYDFKQLFIENESNTAYLR